MAVVGAIHESPAKSAEPCCASPYCHGGSKRPPYGRFSAFYSGASPCATEMLPHRDLSPSLRGMSAFADRGSVLQHQQCHYTPSVKNRLQNADFCQLPQRGSQGYGAAQAHTATAGASARPTVDSLRSTAGASARPTIFSFLKWVSRKPPRGASCTKKALSAVISGALAQGCRRTMLSAGAKGSLTAPLPSGSCKNYSAGIRVTVPPCAPSHTS